MSRSTRALVMRLALCTVALIVTVGLFVSDWPAKFAEGVWKDHSMVSGIVSGLALLLFAAVVVESVVAYLAAKRSERIRNVAYKVLAHVMRQEGQYVHAITSGRTPLRSPLVPVDEALVKRCVKETKRVRKTGGKEGLIERLCEDERWRRAAWLMIRDVRLSLTAALSQWGPVMLQTSELTEDFNRVAGAVDALSPVQRLLNDSRKKNYEKPGRVRGKNWPKQLAEKLEDAQLASIATAEWLHRSIEDDAEFQSAQRRWLSKDALGRLDQHDA